MNNINSLNSIQPNSGVPLMQNVKAAERNAENDSLQNNSNLKQTNELVQEKQKEDIIDSKTISDSVDKANKLVLIFDKSIKFVYNQEVGRNYINVVDNNTDEIIRKIPAEEVRRFIEAVANEVGIVVDKKA